MQHGTRHQLRNRLAGAAAGAAGSTTLSSRLAATRAASDAGATNMFSDVPDTIRLQMELVACASASPDAALAQVIALLVPGDPAKQAAVVEAISTNEPLREQWERAWLALRN